MRFSYPSGSRPLEGYTIKRGIGIGGFGEVYFALNDAGKEVALKKIQRNMDIELRGVRHCLNLKHVNLIALWDIRTNEFGESWVVMEYVPGPSLRDVVEANRTGMPEPDIKRWFTSTASGVAYLHEHGIVHRDLKPGNIFHDQDEHVIKIGDYGLSKFISCSNRSGQTETVGTFHYMAPEIGKGEYGKEIDIYAMGIILYEMITGCVPFEGESTQEIIMKHLTMDADVSMIPETFRRVVSKSLRKDPQKRYRGISEMIRDLPWPDVAEHAAQIVGRHTVGPIRVSTPPKAANVSTAEHPGIPEAEDVSAKQADVGVASKLPPAIIRGGASDASASAEGITLGPLKDSSRHSRRLPLDADSVSSPITQTPSAQESGIHFVGDDQPRFPQPAPEVEEVAPDPIHQLTQVSANGTTLDTIEPLEPHGDPAEPIAVAVQSGLSNLALWWNNANVSTPVRLGLLIIGGIVVVQNSAWLLPAILATGLAYLVYYIGRRALLVRRDPAAAAAQKSARQEQHARRQRVRAWIASRPSSDQATELIGSLLVGAVAAIVLSFLGLAIVGGITDTSMEAWALFTWQTLICVTAVWTVLVATKAWTRRSVSLTFRMLLLAVAGAAVGLIAFFSANSFEIDLARVALEDFEARTTSAYVLRFMPMFPALITSFAALFAISMYSWQTDPLRRTRLSVVNVVMGLIAASALSHLMNVPPTVLCTLAVVVSVSIQLASPWMHPDQQWEVGRVNQ